MISKFKLSKLAYWGIGLILLIWSNIVTSIYGGEAAYLPFIIIILIGMPSSLMAYFLVVFLLSSTPLSLINVTFIESNLIILFILYAGYLQWFHFMAKVIKNEGNSEDTMRNIKNLNAGKHKNKSNN